MKLIKTWLRNKLSQVSLDALICISTEAPEEFSDTEYEFFVDKLKRLNQKNENSFITKVIILTLKNLFYVL